VQVRAGHGSGSEGASEADMQVRGCVCRWEADMQVRGCVCRWEADMQVREGGKQASSVHTRLHRKT
jgi:hypothetical protein